MTEPLLWVIAAGPAALAATGLAARRRAGRIARLAIGATLLSALSLAACAALGGPLHTATLGIAGIGFALYADALTATVYLLVAFVGAIVLRYTERYLDGDPRQERFTRDLCLALAAILLVTLSGNLLQFALGWIATSVALNRLLLFYPDRPAAILASRKKFVTSRLGDVLLLAAIVLIYRATGTLDFAALFAAVDSPAPGAGLPPELGTACVLLAITALLKSAQFPTHGWLTEVMETPTPVSALLHAGIINAGGLLVLRFSHLMAHAPGALDVLLIAGSLSALVGSAVMLTQTSVKVSLAWSTVAQLGFMFMQCGLGAFSAAALHLVAHSLYKAHAFLASGSVIELARARWVPEPEARPRPAGVVAALLGTAGLYAVVARIYGVWPPANPGEFALGAVVSLGLAHLLANVLTARARASVVLRTAATAALVLVAYLGLQRLAVYALAGALPGARALHGLLDTAILTSVLASFAAVTLLQNTLPYRPEGGTWQALHTHLANGLYVNTVVNRWLLAWWPQRARAVVAADRRALLSRGALP